MNLWITITRTPRKFITSMSDRYTIGRTPVPATESGTDQPYITEHSRRADAEGLILAQSKQFMLVF